jgi:O-acetyl-ADP-ribose deacetylase
MDGPAAIQVGGAVIEIVRGDITEQSVDAIVNAANSGLAGGGGVDGAIHSAGGPSIMEECRRIGGCPTGSAVATTGGALPALHVIHAVGPVYQDGRSREPELLASAYRRSLEEARRIGARTIAFPSISTGAYGYPITEASRLALRAVRDAVADPAMGIALVRFVLFSNADLERYREAAREVFGL